MISEKCGCGAEITIDLHKSGTVKDELAALRDWRDNHRHEMPEPTAAGKDVVVTLEPSPDPGGRRPELVVPADALERLGSAAGQFLTLMNKLSGPNQGRGDGF